MSLAGFATPAGSPHCSAGATEEIPAPPPACPIGCQHVRRRPGQWAGGALGPRPARQPPGLGALAGLLESSHRVLAPDRPGYGGTGGPALGLAANADALAGLLDHAGISAATVVGHSWGGGVALALAQRHPGRVSGLVLVASIGTAAGLGTFDRVRGPARHRRGHGVRSPHPGRAWSLACSAARPAACRAAWPRWQPAGRPPGWALTSPVARSARLGAPSPSSSGPCWPRLRPWRPAWGR